MAGGDAPTWGKKRQALLTLQEAWAVIEESFGPAPGSGTPGGRVVGSEAVSFQDALGRVLAAPISTPDDYPAFDKSMMDGFAVRAADCASAGARLDIRGLVSAGQVFDERLGAGEAVQINTGACVPNGADAVVRIEDTRVEGQTVLIQVAVKAGQSIAGRGTTRRAGDTVLAPPLRLGPAHIAAAAASGVAEIEVRQRVGAAIVSTGDELVRSGKSRRPGEIYDSNGPMLAGMLRDFGAAPRDLGIIRDEPDKLKKSCAEALGQPVVMVIGGMSMGTLDLVPQAFEELGVRWLFHGVQVRPGKPVAYGRGPDGQHVFGLPGNPASVFTCAWLFVRMVIRGLLGYAVAPPETVTARLGVELKPHRDARPAFIPASVSTEAGLGLSAAPCRWDGSGDPFGLAEADALLVWSDPARSVPAGSSVEVILLRGHPSE